MSYNTSMNTRLDLEQLASAFSLRTGCSMAKARKLASKYCFVCAVELLKNTNWHEDNYYRVGLYWLRNQLNRIQVQRQTFWIWNEFQSLKERIIVPIGIGNNIKGKLSQVQINYTLEDIIIASGRAEDLVAHVYQPYEEEIARDQVDYVKINLNSLQGLILGNQTTTRTDQNRQKLDQNLRDALKIRLIAEASDGYLPQVRSLSEFGRLYYRGPNLQTVSKEVRHAALGQCSEYDIENSVVAWKLGLFPAAYKEYPVSADYIQFKQAIRRQITESVFGHHQAWAQTIIKSAITAIGFGARSTQKGGFYANGRWTNSSLADIIRGPEHLERFLTTAWIEKFTQEQTQMNQQILASARQNQLIPERTQLESLYDTAGRLRTNTAISYLYQQSERSIIRQLVQIFEPYEVLLIVHDCIYTRHAVNANTLQEARLVLQQTSEFFKLDHQLHQPWAFDQNLYTHKQRIEQEEQRAQLIYGISSHRLRPDSLGQDSAVSLPQERDHWSGQGYLGDPNDYDRELDPYYVDDSDWEYEQLLTEQAGYALR